MAKEVAFYMNHCVFKVLLSRQIQFKQISVTHHPISTFTQIYVTKIKVTVVICKFLLGLQTIWGFHQTLIVLLC